MAKDLRTMSGTPPVTPREPWDEGEMSPHPRNFPPPTPGPTDLNIPTGPTIPAPPGPTPLPKMGPSSMAPWTMQSGPGMRPFAAQGRPFTGTMPTPIPGMNAAAPAPFPNPTGPQNPRRDMVMQQLRRMLMLQGLGR